MPGSEHWISSRVLRTLFLLFAINAGTVIGDLLLGQAGSVLGAFTGFTIALTGMKMVARV